MTENLGKVLKKRVKNNTQECEVIKSPNKLLQGLTVANSIRSQTNTVRDNPLSDDNALYHREVC